MEPLQINVAGFRGEVGHQQAMTVWGFPGQGADELGVRIGHRQQGVSACAIQRSQGVINRVHRVRGGTRGQVVKPWLRLMFIATVHDTQGARGCGHADVGHASGHQGGHVAQCPRR